MRIFVQFERQESATKAAVDLQVGWGVCVSVTSSPYHLSVARNGHKGSSRPAGGVGCVRVRVRERRMLPYTAVAARSTRWPPRRRWTCRWGGVGRVRERYASPVQATRCTRRLQLFYCRGGAHAFGSRAFCWLQRSLARGKAGCTDMACVVAVVWAHAAQRVDAPNTPDSTQLQRAFVASLWDSVLAYCALCLATACQFP